jgi:hypothetical protein
MRLLSWKFAQTESRNNMKKYYVLISRVYERIISQNTRKGMKFPDLFQTWRYRKEYEFLTELY